MTLNRVLYDDITVFSLLSAILVFACVLLLAKSISIYLRRLLKDRMSKERSDVIIKMVYYGTILLVLATVLPMIGVRLSGLLFAGGIVGIAVGFASQNIIGNLLSGLFLFSNAR